MSRKYPFLVFFLALLLSSPTGLWAKKKRTPTPTPTATPADTPTETPTLTPVPNTGAKLYTFDALWGSKGSDLNQLNDPEGISIDKDGRLFIADKDNNRILVWDQDGTPLASYGSFGTRADWRNPPQFNHPSAVFVPPSKQIYVSDTLNHRIVILDEKGLVVSTFGTQGSEAGKFNLPRTLCEDHFGNIWVLDSGNSRVQVFSNLGVFNSAWGSFGTDASSNTMTAVMNQPLGMALNGIDQVIVADTGNSRMEIYNNGGVPVTVQGWYGEDGPYIFKEPSGAAVTPSGIAAIADGTSGRVVFYNSRNGDFEFLGEWRAKDEMADSKSKPRFRGIAADAQNRLYVTDIQNNTVIRLKPLAKETKGEKEADATPTTVPASTPTPTPQDYTPFGGAGYPIR